MGEKRVDLRTATYNILIDLQYMMRVYGYGKLSDQQWEALVSDSEKIYVKYKECDERIVMLFRNLYSGVRNFYCRPNQLEISDVKKVMSDIFKDIWWFTERYGYQELNPDQLKLYRNNIERFRAKYGVYGENVTLLSADVIKTLNIFYSVEQKEAKNEHF